MKQLSSIIPAELEYPDGKLFSPSTVLREVSEEEYYQDVIKRNEEYIYWSNY